MTAAGLLLEGCGFLPADQSKVWQPARVLLPSPDSLQTGLDYLQSCLASTSYQAALAEQTSGLGVLIPFLLADTLTEFTPPHPTAAAAITGVRILRDWLYTGAASDWRAPASVIRLLGLGPGLTPSGDDFLIGLLVSLHALSRPKAAACLAAQLLPLALERTNVVSVAHLRCAAQGQAIAPLHQLLQALCADAADVPLALSVLVRIGHSSGWDSIAGLLLANLAYQYSEVQ